ncbi:HNH endonuclease [Zhihengliuella sp. ISTPL4]|uniref:HNH endonuclease n=1 Tax=Zhihengliuella sp. ISTPL4 TaxID=2058657 RepID=UPI000C7BBBCA|nr:HNH endonuclease [Zhihengliuella sp. ISTPL4]
MIALSKSPAPEVLVVNGGAWAEEYVTAVRAGNAKTAERWRHSEIVGSLRRETGERCAYCESLIEDVAYPHVEHIAPKSKFPELAHAWSNLTWACPKCNIAKGDFYHPTEGLLNPFVDDPLNHMDFVGAMVMPRLNDARGRLTERKLRLNRSGLLKSRARRLESLLALVQEWNLAEGALRDVLEEAIRRDVDAGEYRQSALAFLSRYGFSDGASAPSTLAS